MIIKVSVNIGGRRNKGAGRVDLVGFYVTSTDKTCPGHISDI